MPLDDTARAAPPPPAGHAGTSAHQSLGAPTASSPGLTNSAPAGSPSPGRFFRRRYLSDAQIAEQMALDAEQASRFLGKRRRRASAAPPPDQAAVDALVADYLARGGRVTECPPAHAQTRGVLDMVEALSGATEPAPRAEPGEYRRPHVINHRSPTQRRPLDPNSMAGRLRALAPGDSLTLAGDGTERQRRSVVNTTHRVGGAGGFRTTLERGVGVRVRRVG